MGAALNIIAPNQSPSFIENDEVTKIIDRALVYLKAGYPIHLSGPTGTGKTTLAFRLSSLLKRPTVMMHGDETMKSNQLTGDQNGYQSKRVIDNYISSVRKTEEKHQKNWTDSRLTKACKSGYTLIYDEYNRSKPGTNNLFLSILEEGILELPFLSNQGLIKVHPEFRCIFTSNPEEYAGTHASQDALLDRMITIHIEGYSIETEVMIIHSKGEVELKDATRLAWLIKEYRNQIQTDEAKPTLRSGIMIARACKQAQISLHRSEPMFYEICKDILGNIGINKGANSNTELSKRYALIHHLIEKNFISATETKTSGIYEEKY